MTCALDSFMSQLILSSPGSRRMQLVSDNAKTIRKREKRRPSRRSRSHSLPKMNRWAVESSHSIPKAPTSNPFSPMMGPSDKQRPSRWESLTEVERSNLRCMSLPSSHRNWLETSKTDKAPQFGLRKEALKACKSLPTSIRILPF
jgi:hypothetical protein